MLREQGRRQHIEDLYNDGNVKGRSVMRHSVPSDTADLCTRRYASTNASCPRSVVSRDNFHSREGILKHAATVVAAVAAVGELAAFDLRGSYTEVRLVCWVNKHAHAQTNSTWRRA